MKKVIGLLLTIVIISSCTQNSNDSKETLKVADFNTSPITYREIRDNKKINKIYDILSDLQWSDHSIETNGDPDYSFWLEQKGVEMRVKNNELWVGTEHNVSVIIDHITTKFAVIEDNDLQNLLKLLKYSDEKN